MKSRNLFIGVIIVFVGVVSLLSSLGVVDFQWRVAWRLWPMLLIIVGIAILPFKDWLKSVLLLVALAIGVMLYQQEEQRFQERFNSGWVNSVGHWWDWFDDDLWDCN